MFLMWDRADSISSHSLPSFREEKKWSSADYLDEETDSGVGCIRFNDNGILAMSIRQKDLIWRVDLFDRDLIRIRRGLSFAEKGEDLRWQCLLWPMIGNEWLVMNHAGIPQMLSILDREGKVKQQVQRKGYNVALLGTAQLVMRDQNGINLYRIW